MDETMVKEMNAAMKAIYEKTQGDIAKIGVCHVKMKRDTITGLVGLIASITWIALIQVQTTQPPKLLEPGPRLLPYVAFVVVFISSVMLLIKGLRDWKQDPNPDKPYFPKGGKLKVTKSYLMLVVYGVLMPSSTT